VCCIDHHSDGFCTTPPDRALAQLAVGQWGVVSRAQLVALGLGRGAIEARLRNGRLRRLHRGVYAIGGAHLPPRGRWLAAVLACGPGAFLSHRSAAAHWGLLQSRAARVEVTAPATRRGATGIRLHRARSLDAGDTTTHQGIPTTTVARTLLDLAATLHRNHLERALAQAERLRLYDHRAIADVLARSNGHRGRAILMRATVSDPSWTQNDFEARFLELVREAGLPEPLVNEAHTGPDHVPITPDFHWPAGNLIVETDGWETHGTRAAFEADRRKDAALTAAGYRVMRFTWREVRDRPGTVVRRLRAVYAAASASRNPSSSTSSIE
jgi:hypothetical protein